MMDILSWQLVSRFEGMKSVVTSYQVLEPSFLSNASHLDLEVEARKFSEKFSDNISPLFPSQMLSIKNASLATTYPDVYTEYMMYMTVPVTAAMAKRFFLN